MHDNKRPMLPVRTNDSLKKALKSAAPSGRAGEPVRSITMVGAFLEEGFACELSPADESYLLKIFDICAENSIPIAEDVEINITNLFYGDHHDFLEHPEPTDMAVMSYLFYDPIALARHNGKESFFIGTLQSPHANDPNRWHNALVNTGARYAFNIVGGLREHELPTEFLERAPYRRIDTTLGFPGLEYDLLAR